MNRSTTKKHWAPIFLAFLVAGFSATCRREKPAAAAKPNVIIISIDTLRSDHLPAYGYDGVETPSLDAFRREAVLYESAWSHIPLTLPSHATMFTGRLPADNGVRDNVGYRLSKDVPTLAEVLKRDGWQTGAAVSAYVLREETGVARGFDFYDDGVEPLDDAPSLGRIQRQGGDTEAVARQWLSSERDRSQPVFFFLHLYDPHSPYEPPAPFDEKYREKPYDGEIAYVDSVLGDFFSFLREQNLFDSSMIIVVSDHGEGLNQHGEMEHGIFLYREAIQVPLMIRYPDGRGAGSTESKPAMLADLFPTVLDSVGLGGIGPKATGRPLSTIAAAAPRRVYSETFYPRIHFGWSDLHSLTDGKNHYIEAPRPELYDLAADPAEKVNVLEENRRTYFDLHQTIEPLIREPSSPEEVDPEMAAQLAALGYLSGGPVTEGGDLPDPKDEIGSMAEVMKAFSTFRQGNIEQALSEVREQLKKNPRVLDLWDLEGRALARLGRLDEAAESAKQSLKLSPGSSHRALNVARLSLQAGNLDDAEKHARLAIEAEPGAANDVLARVALERRDFATAGQLAKAALAASPDEMVPHMTLARIEKEQGHLDSAWTELEEALRLARQKHLDRVEGLHFLRGDVLARLKRPNRAEIEFRQEIATFPEQPQAYKNLILLLVAEKRIPDAERVIADLVDANPTPPAFIAISETLGVIGDPRAARYWARRGLEKFPNDAKLRELSRRKAE